MAFENPPPDHDPFPADPRRRIEGPPPRPRAPAPFPRRPWSAHGRKAILIGALVMTLGLVVRLELFDAHERHTKRKQDELHERLGPATIRLTEGVTADGKPGMRLRFGDLDRVVRFAAPGSLVRLDPEWDQVLDEVAKRIPRAATGWIGLRFDVASALRKEPHDIATELLIDRIRSLAGPAPWERDFDGAPAIR